MIRRRQLSKQKVDVDEENTRNCDQTGKLANKKNSQLLTTSLNSGALSVDVYPYKAL
uniref:Uncharacterized protein n=1 Tax=Arundo donax TaxID=35708 RepID=A0A0A9F5W9_ARUDO